MAERIALWVFGVIGKARELISVKKRWCTHTLARTKTGREADPRRDNATQWCALGAVMNACGYGTRFKGRYQKVCQVIVGDLLDSRYNSGVALLTCINDGPDGYRKVLKLFDKVLKMRPLNYKKAR